MSASTRQVLLALDVGTSSARVRLIAPGGEEVDSAVVPARTVTGGQGISELDGDALWADVVKLTSQVVRDGISVLGVGVTAQLGTVLLNGHGQTITGAILWSDTRARAEAEEMAGRFGSDSARIAGRRVTPELLAPRLEWLRRHKPEILSRATKVVSLKDFLVFKLTGRILTDETHASYSGLFDVDRRCWSDLLLSEFAVDASLLPTVVPATQLAGAVTARSAAETGLPVGTLVVSGCPDGTAGSVGAGAVRAGVTVDVAGTSDTVLHTTSKPLRDEKGALIVNAHVIPGLWTVGGPTGLTGGTVAWVMGLLGLADRAESTLAEALTKIPPGADAVVFRGALTGSRFPDWNSNERGVIAGLNLSCGPLQVVRSALEGAAFTVAAGLDACRGCGCSVEEVVVVGGLAANSDALQLRADCLGVPVVRLDKQEASSVGIAMLAGVGAGVYRDVIEAESAMVVRAERIEPNPLAVPVLLEARRRWKALSLAQVQAEKN